MSKGMTMATSPAAVTPSLTVTRSDDGIASFSYTDGSFTKTASGFWDDTTPWAAGSYTLDFKKKSSTGNDSFLLESVADRTGIMIHDGKSKNWSEGCLVVGQSFIDSIYSDLQAQSLSTKAGTQSTIAFKVVNDFDAHLNLSATQEVKEGSPVTLTVSLTGAGGKNGLSKDVYVKLDDTGGTAIEGANYDHLNTLAGEVSIEDDPGWIKIAAGKTSVSVTLPTIATSASQAASASFKTAQISIVDYRIVNNGKSGPDYYKDEANILTASGGTSASVKIDSQSSVVGSAVNASGGNEGYNTLNQFAPGQTLGLFFDPYTIPDEFKISTSTGQVLVDTGFIGGHTYSGSLTVPGNSDGNLRIQVLTNDPGTAWTFTVTPQNTKAAPALPAAALAATALPAAAVPTASAAATAAVTAPVTIRQNDQYVLTNDTDVVGLTFSVIVNDTSLAGHTIAWKVAPSGLTAGALSDFPAGSALSGTFTVPQGTKAGTEIFVQELPTPTQVSQAGGIDTFSILLTDQATKDLVRASTGQAVAASFSVINSFKIASQIVGTSGNDTLAGTADADVIVGGLGDDLINAGGGNDFIDGGAGNDTINAGDGNDLVSVGFGTDTVDGGAGDDSIVLPRNKADVTITTNASLTTTVVDNSLVPLGTKTLKNVEHIRFVDQTFDLKSSSVHDLTVKNTNTGATVTTNGSPYTGPVKGLAYEYINITPDNLNITANRPNMFLHSGDGFDAIDVHGVNGTNVLDGGTNSNFLVGGTGSTSIDTFFVDDRNATADIWSTVSNFHAGDAATIWGITTKDFTLSWVDNQGAAGFTGLTLHATATGKPTASLTLAGFAKTDLTNGRLAVTFGTEPVSGSSYMNVFGIK
jgi:hypothetical protein